MSQCRVHLTHPDKTQARCLLDADHLLDDSDHLDEHGHTAKVLVTQASIREIAHWSKIPFPWEREGGELRLYLWRDVLHDYSAGMAFAIATSADDARGMLIRQVGHSGDDFAKEPEIHELTEPFAAHVYGGG